MADIMIELDVEELLDLASFEKPVLSFAITDGNLFDISDDVLEVFSFTSGGIVSSLVYGVGALVEIDTEELIEPVGFSYEKPVGWLAVNSGLAQEIPIGAKPPWPGDTLTLIDFDEDYGGDLSLGSPQGLIFVAINSRSGILLGSMADSVLGFNGISAIKFLVPEQYADLVA